jgi:hypothetical protein
VPPKAEAENQRGADILFNQVLDLLRGKESDVSKKTQFLDTFLGYVQALDISLEKSWLSIAAKARSMNF